MKLICTLLAWSIFAWLQGAPSWPVPQVYEQMENPVEFSPSSIAIGKALYRAHCRSCHSTGDGTQAPVLNADLVKVQKDGGLFYKIREGRNDTHVFKHQIPSEEDTWHLVNYLRSL